MHMKLRVPGKEKWNDRHRIIAPDKGTRQGIGGPTNTVPWAGYLNGMKDRVGDLFKTKQGLDRHISPIQDGLRSLKKAEPAASVLVVDRLQTALQKSASAAKFDFPEFALDVPSLKQQIVCRRQEGVAKVFKRPAFF